MPLCVRGVRLGTRIYTPARFVINGEITDDDDDAIKYLREIGYRIKRCRGVPEWKPSEEELEQMAAADKYLGIHRGESGTTRMERDIKKGMRDWLAPIRNALRGIS